MDCLSYCRKGPASPQFAQSAQWCKQRYCIDLIYPILLLVIQPFALLAVGLPAVSSRWLSAVPLLPSVSSRWCFATAPHGLPVFIGGPTRSNFAAASLPAVYSRWLSATVPPSSSPWPSASNKPHQTEKSTPVWLAIWRT